MTRIDPQTGLRVAIAHDYLTQFGGAERVVLSMLKAFPEADVYTTLYEPDRTFPDFRERRVHTSWLNRFGLLRREHRAALPLLPAASSSIEVDADVVLCSSSGWAHGFRTNGIKVVYCHSPARFVYLSREYLGRSGRALGPLLHLAKPWLRRWDHRAQAESAVYLANSRVVADRVHAYYGRDAIVVPAPHSIDVLGEQDAIELPWTEPDFDLLVSRLLPYKNVDVALRAYAQMPQRRLVVVGRGPLLATLRKQAPENVTVLGGVSDAQLRWAYAHASLLIAPAREDYGLTPLEAAAFGTPTVALRAGGYLDTVVEQVSGSFFDQADEAHLVPAVRSAASYPWSASRIREHASVFGERQFAERLRGIVTEVMQV